MRAHHLTASLDILCEHYQRAVTADHIHHAPINRVTRHDAYYATRWEHDRDPLFARTVDCECFAFDSDVLSSLQGSQSVAPQRGESSPRLLVLCPIRVEPRRKSLLWDSHCSQFVVTTSFHGGAQMVTQGKHIGPRQHMKPSRRRTLAL